MQRHCRTGLQDDRVLLQQPRISSRWRGSRASWQAGSAGFGRSLGSPLGVKPVDGALTYGGMGYGVMGWDGRGQRRIGGMGGWCGE